MPQRSGQRLSPQMRFNYPGVRTSNYFHPIQKNQLGLRPNLYLNSFTYLPNQLGKSCQHYKKNYSDYPPKEQIINQAMPPPNLPDLGAVSNGPFANGTSHFARPEHHPNPNTHAPFFPYHSKKTQHHINWYLPAAKKRSFEEFKEASRYFSSQQTPTFNGFLPLETQQVLEHLLPPNAEKKNTHTLDGIFNLGKYGENSCHHNEAGQGNLRQPISSGKSGFVRIQEKGGEMESDERAKGHLVDSLIGELRLIQKGGSRGPEFREKVGFFTRRWNQILREKQRQLGYQSVELL